MSPFLQALVEELGRNEASMQANCRSASPIARSARMG